ncbi:MAG: hypothetical protein ACJAVI_004288 [Candidatus Azotimanducaceae bacterium]|jgi:hypothetical protein
MKKILLVVAAILLAACLALWVKGNAMREIKTEIEISAPASEVWAILTNIDDWENWSPIINQSSGEASLGSALSITMMSEEEGKDGPKYSPLITNLDDSKLFRWRAIMMAGFVMTNDKVFQLEETSTGTRLIHKELFSGMVVPLFWSNVEKNVPAMLNSMNEALKVKAEEILD